MVDVNETLEVTALRGQKCLLLVHNSIKKFVGLLGDILFVGLDEIVLSLKKIDIFPITSSEVDHRARLGYNRQHVAKRNETQALLCILVVPDFEEPMIRCSNLLMPWLW